MTGHVTEEAVRLANVGDAAVLGELEHAARAQLVDQRGGPALLDEEPAVEEWLTILADVGNAVFVASVDGHVFGYLQLVLGERRGVVRQVYIDPEARELGLGDMLLAAATATARAAGCSVLEGTALPGDRATKNLYERAGIVARKIVVSKRL